MQISWPFIPRQTRNLGAIENMDPFHPACLEPNDPPVQLLGPGWLEVQINPNKSCTTTRHYMDSGRFVIFCRSFFSSDVGWPRNKSYKWIHKVAATISPIDLRWFSSRWLTPSTRCYISKISTTANNEHLGIKYLSPKVGKIQVN